MHLVFLALSFYYQSFPNADVLNDYGISQKPWHWFMFFTNQVNILAIFVFIGPIKKFKKFNYRIFEILVLSWLIVVSLVYWSTIFPKKVSEKLIDPAEFFLTLWVHMMTLIAVFIHYYLCSLSKFYNRDPQKINLGFFTYKKPFIIGCIYPLAYFLVVVVGVQAIDPEHFSVYGSATIWYHWIEPKLLEIPNNAPPRTYLTGVFGLFILVSIWGMCYFNNWMVLKKLGYLSKDYAVFGGKDIAVRIRVKPTKDMKKLLYQERNLCKKLSKNPTTIIETNPSA